MINFHIDYKFSDVRDVHDILEVTVYDEDKDHKYEFLGKVRRSVIGHCRSLKVIRVSQGSKCLIIIISGQSTLRLSMIIDIFFAY